LSRSAQSDPACKKLIEIIQKTMSSSGILPLISEKRQDAGATMFMNNPN
jgi:hypothetical protein